MSKVTGKLLAMILSFVMVFTGVTFLGGTVAVNAAEGDTTLKVKLVDSENAPIEGVLMNINGTDDGMSDFTFDGPVTDGHGNGVSNAEGYLEWDYSSENIFAGDKYLIVPDEDADYTGESVEIEFGGEDEDFYLDKVGGQPYSEEDVYEITLTAKEPPQPEVVTVTFNAQGGTVDPASAEVGAEGKLASLPEPVYEGFDFLGWFDAAEGGNEVTLDKVYTENTTIFAHWKEAVDVDAPYDANDFTYGEFILGTDPSYEDAKAVYPGNDHEYMLPGTKWVVTGFSDSGAAKFLAGHTDLVIPANDPDGKVVQGVGEYAFNAGTTNPNTIIKNSDYRITSVTFPEGVKTTDNVETINQKWANYLGKHGPLTEVGDFFICYSAFEQNNIEEVVIPEGTLFLGYRAFYGNKSLKKITLPSTLAVVSNYVFYNAPIEELNFPEETDIRLSIRNFAFAGAYTFTEVDLPKDTLQVMAGRAPAFFKKNTTLSLNIKGKESALVESLSNYNGCTVNINYLPIKETFEEVPATCEEPGQEAYYKCLACGKFFTDEDLTQEGTGAAIPALGHDWELTEVTKEPTADEDGEGLYTCKHDASHTKTDAVSYVYEITFNAGEGASCEVEKVNTGKNGKLKSLPEATNSGKTLIGWFDAEEDGNEVTLDTVFEADATVYARWRDQTPVETVEELVSELPTDVTVDDKDAIEAAREAYEALSAEEKAQLPPTTELRIETAEAKLEAAEADVKADEAQQLANVATAKVILAADIVDATTAGVTAAKYTKSTYDAFVTALDGAKTALKDPAATVESIHAASTDLQTAVDSLKLKGTNTMKVTAKKVTFKAATLKKKTLSVAASKAFTVKTPSGKVTYKKSSGNSKITVASTGKITAKKGLAKGTYSVKVKVTAAGDDDHKPLTKTVTVKVVVK